MDKTILGSNVKKIKIKAGKAPYEYCNNLAGSRNNCYRNTNTRSLCIIVELHVTVSNVKVFTLVTGTKFGFLLPPFSSYKIFHAFVSNLSSLGLHTKRPTLCAILNTFGISRQTFLKAPCNKIHENLSSGNNADTCGQTAGRTDGRTDRHAEANGRFSQLK